MSLNISTQKALWREICIVHLSDFDFTNWHDSYREISEHVLVIFQCSEEI